LYFTEDRPVKMTEQNKTDCPMWNDYRYALNKFSSKTYKLPLGGDPAKLFKRFAKRDLRILVGLDDVSANLFGGDQSCMAQAMGGKKRVQRNLAAWKYYQLLAGGAPSTVSKFFGDFPALDSTSKQASQAASKANSRQQELAQFKVDGGLIHKLGLIPGAQHDAEKEFLSERGMTLLFAPNEVLFNDVPTAVGVAASHLG
jgi:hypothetical protein